ncbi:hypothetical protein Baya_5380 [Bagarius yarrelli]|uniref:BCLAF1 and THRAP3 family member 3 n=1 Tax=Bagarius yarrelli TaxID=175774 RepID=A0A556TWR1_BAGYA|nr:hypothetical protein Baya_5380 [Bagarius yarrelli]
MAPHLHLKQFEDLDPQEEYSVPHRGFSPHSAPIIVEHGHGFPKHDLRSHNPGRERERPTSHDSARERGDPRKHSSSRGRERPRSREPARDQEHSRFGNPVRARENPRSHDPVVHRRHPMSHNPFKDREFPRGSGPVRHQEHPRNRDLQRDRDDLKRDLQRGGDPNKRRGSNELQHQERHYNRHTATSHDGHGGSLNCRFREDTDFYTSSAESWKKEMHSRENVLKGSSQCRNSNHPGAKMDFASYETLRIKVDMSRPVGQSSHLGYSSERQLSLDLVNVGRQRLDFLPMLEHSGTFTETAMHSGTFAQEIITLVHHVKENYFQGQGMPLNERFSNEQEYSLMDDFIEDEQEMDGIGPVVNRPPGSTSSDTQIFCKINTLQRKPHFPAPGDLRHDLERKRLERLEGVKITIAGQNFSQILPQSQEIESVYAGDEDLCETGWSNDEPQQPDHWVSVLVNLADAQCVRGVLSYHCVSLQQDKTSRKRPASNSDSRWYFKRACHRQGARMKRNPNDGN